MRSLEQPQFPGRQAELSRTPVLLMPLFVLQKFLCKPDRFADDGGEAGGAAVLRIARAAGLGLV